VWHTEAKASQAEQQKAAQQHQKDNQTLSRHGRKPKKQQKLFSEAQLALPEPQKL
jgi:hypothetical protein